MSTRPFTKRKAATSDLDPATLAEQQLLERQRARARRTLRKRRQQKSHLSRR